MRLPPGRMTPASSCPCLSTSTPGSAAPLPRSASSWSGGACFSGARAKAPSSSALLCSSASSAGGLTRTFGDEPRYQREEVSIYICVSFGRSRAQRYLASSARILGTVKYLSWSLLRRALVWSVSLTGTLFCFLPFLFPGGICIAETLLNHFCWV